MKSRNSVLLDKILVLFWIVFLLINVITEYITRYVGGVGVIALNYVFMACFLLSYGKRNRNRISVLPFLIFLVFYIIEYQMIWQGGRVYNSFGVDFNIYVWNMISTFPFIITAVQIVNKSDDEMQRWVRKCFLITLIIVCIASIGILRVFPDASRLNATASSGAYYPFLAGYGIIYGITILLPYMLLLLSENNTSRILPLVALVVMLVCVFMAAYTIALVAVVIGVGCYVFLKIKNRFLKAAVLVVFISFLVYVFVTGIHQEFLFWLADAIPIEKVSERIRDTAKYMSSGVAGNSAGRFLLYAKAMQLIVAHPIIGNFVWDPYVSLSEHSTNLDVIGSCGLIVFLIYAKFLYNIYSSHMHKCSTPLQKSAVISSFIVFLFISTVNVVMSSGQIFVFLLIGILFVNNRSLEEPSDEESVTITS